MSIASEILALIADRNGIRNALVNKGVPAAANHGYDDFAEDISSIPTGGTYQSKSVRYTTNGTRTITPDSGYNALSSVSVNVDVSGEPPSLQQKSVTPNKDGMTVLPDSGYDGLSQVTVAGDNNLIAGNIKKDVTIFGVNGTYQGAGEGGNGSLIVCTISGNITSVKAVYNVGGVTVEKAADLYSALGEAYVTIPHTVTGNVTVQGYSSESLVGSASVTITGVDKYECAIVTTSLLYGLNTATGQNQYYGIGAHQWYDYQYSRDFTSTVEGDIAQHLRFQGSGYSAALTPAIHSRGYSRLNVHVSQIGGAVRVGAKSTPGTFDDGTYLYEGDNLININADSNGYFYLGYAVYNGSAAYIDKIEFV